MKITAIKTQVKRAGRYSVFVDDAYAFSLSDTALLEVGIAKGQEISKEQLAGFKRLSADDKLYGNALNYLAIRVRSVWEMQTYLQRKDAAPELAEKIIGKLEKLGLLDDRSFAVKWVESRRLLKPTSKRKLTLELRAKRVPQAVIAEVLGEEETTDQDTLRELVARKRKQTRYQDKLKLMQYLARQGYDYDDIKNALQVEEQD